MSISVSVNTSQNSTGGIGGGGSGIDVPVVPADDSFEWGVGGDFLPIVLAAAPQDDEPEFFAAGASDTVGVIAVLALVSLGVIYRESLAAFVSRGLASISSFRRRAGALALAVALPLFPLAAPAIAAGPVDPVGPQGEIGPQGPVGPQGPRGPQGAIGPQANYQPESAPDGDLASEEESAAPAADSGVASQSVGQSNNETGANSSNSNSTSTSNSTNASVTNTASFDNDIDASVSTGGNAATQNTRVGTVRSGDINGVINLVNVGNSVLGEGSSVGTQSLDAGNASEIVLGQAGNRTLIGNQANGSTGANSTNSNYLQGSGNSVLTAVNTATVDNDVAIAADTGNNILDSNTEVGDVTTGDINLAVNEINLQNLMMPSTQVNVDIWSIALSNPNAVINLANADTGSQSANSNSVNDSSSANITVERIANATNGVTVNGNTGNNAATENTQIGDIQTGEVNVGGSVVNVANAGDPVFYVLNVFGPWNGSVVGLAPGNYIVNNVNDETGAGSQNGNAISQSDLLTGTFSSTADVDNSITVDANTGSNVFNRNTSVGAVRTGSVNVLANIFNVLNGWSATMPSFRIGIINLFSTAGAGAMGGSSDSVPLALPEVVTDIASGDDTASASLALGGGEFEAGKEVSTASAAAGSGSVRGAIHTSSLQSEAGVSLAEVPLKVSLQSAADNFEPIVPNAAQRQQPEKRSLSWLGILLALGAGSWFAVESIAYVAARRRGY